MSNNSITSANAIFALAIDGIFTSPQQLQGFAADDIFDTPAIAPTEFSMGLDGKLSAGWVPVAIAQSITLQADSDSIVVFDTWYATQVSQRDVYFANATIMLPSVGLVYTMKRGVLTGYAPLSDAKKMLQPRKFTITWESAQAGPM